MGVKGILVGWPYLLLRTKYFQIIGVRLSDHVESVSLCEGFSPDLNSSNSRSGNCKFYRYFDNTRLSGAFGPVAPSVRRVRYASASVHIEICALRARM